MYTSAYLVGGYVKAGKYGSLSIASDLNLPAPFALWRMDGDSRDATGNPDQDLTLVGLDPDEFPDGRFGQAFPTTCGASVVALGEIPVTGTYSIVAWLYVNGNDASVSFPGVANETAAAVRATGTSRIEGYIEPEILTSDPLSAGWHQAILTVAASVGKLYVDGVLVDTLALTGTDSISPSVSLFGSPASIDDVAIFNIALTDQNIADLGLNRYPYPLTKLRVPNFIEAKPRPNGIYVKFFQIPAADTYYFYQDTVGGPLLGTGQPTQTTYSGTRFYIDLPGLPAAVDYTVKMVARDSRGTALPSDPYTFSGSTLKPTPPELESTTFDFWFEFVEGAVFRAASGTAIGWTNSDSVARLWNITQTGKIAAATAGAGTIPTMFTTTAPFGVRFDTSNDVLLFTDAVLAGEFTLYLVVNRAGAAVTFPILGCSSTPAFIGWSTGTFTVTNDAASSVTNTTDFGANTGQKLYRVRRAADGTVYVAATGIAEVSLGILTGNITVNALGRQPNTAVQNGNANNRLLMATAHLSDATVVGYNAGMVAYSNQVFGSSL